MLTVLITYTDDTTDIKDCWDLDELCLDFVKELKIIRNDKAA